MAHYEKHGRLTCERRPDGRWRGQLVVELINQQKIQKLVVVAADGPGVGPDFRVSLYASERSASPEPYADDPLFLVMPPVEGEDGLASFFDVAGYAFQDRDTPLTEIFGKLRVVVDSAHDGEEPPAYLVAVGGDVPGATTHGATICLA